jgi:hypothetical protein
MHIPVYPALGRARLLTVTQLPPVPVAPAPNKLLAVVVGHHEARGLFLDRPRRREAAARSMQPLMHDQPQPTCGRPENSGAERSRADHHGAK